MTVEVPAPSAGVLSDIVPEGTTVAVGAILGSISEGAGAPAKATPPPAAKPARPDGDGTAAAAARPALAPRRLPRPLARRRQPPREPQRSEMPPAPAARKLMEERGLSENDVVGSGRRGQVLKGDVMEAPAKSAPAPLPRLRPLDGRAGAADARALARQRRCARGARTMTRLRQTIARRLKEAQDAAAMLTTFNDVDMSAIMKLRPSTRTCSRSATA